MPSAQPERLQYGPRKYAALHLLISRWLRLGCPTEGEHVYVTLAGTELKDVCSLEYMDPRLTRKVYAYEEHRERFKHASRTASDLRGRGVDVTVIQDTFFSYQRELMLPHIFYFDLEGICAWSDYDQRFGEMFQEATISEGDCLIITSHLGHNPGMKHISKLFGGEFGVLGIEGKDRVREAFRTHHPSFTLFKGLCLKHIASEVKIRCLGAIKYRDSSRTPMGVYVYSVCEGSTELKSLVSDPQTKYFDMNAGVSCSSQEF
jgi:hypothetical protein